MLLTRITGQRSLAEMNANDVLLAVEEGAIWVSIRLCLEASVTLTNLGIVLHVEDIRRVTDNEFSCSRLPPCPLCATSSRWRGMVGQPEKPAHVFGAMFFRSIRPGRTLLPLLLVLKHKSSLLSYYIALLRTLSLCYPAQHLHIPNKALHERKSSITRHRLNTIALLPAFKLLSTAYTPRQPVRRDPHKPTSGTPQIYRYLPTPTLATNI